MVSDFEFLFLETIGTCVGGFFSFFPKFVFVGPGFYPYFRVEYTSPESFLISIFYVFGNYGDLCGGLFLIFPKFTFFGPG